MYSISPQQGVKGGVWRSKYPVTHQKKWPIERWNKCPIIDLHCLLGKRLQLSTQTRSVCIDKWSHTAIQEVMAAVHVTCRTVYVPLHPHSLRRSNSATWRWHAVWDSLSGRPHLLGSNNTKSLLTLPHPVKEQLLVFQCESLMERRRKGLRRGRERGEKKYLTGVFMPSKKWYTYIRIDVHVPIQPVHQKFSAGDSSVAAFGSGYAKQFTVSWHKLPLNLPSHIFPIHVHISTSNSKALRKQELAALPTEAAQLEPSQPGMQWSLYMYMYITAITIGWLL